MANASDDRYDPATVEERWRRTWDERGTNSFTREELAAIA